MPLDRPRLEAEFDRLTRRFLEAGAFAGVVARVEGPEGLLFEAARGRSRADGGLSLAMETSARFDLASVTKLFTTTAIFRLFSQGRLNLEDRVIDILDWDGLAPALKDLDLASLLSHSSGLHYWYPFYTRRGEAFEAILADVLKAFPPKAQVIYSDLNFMILGRVVEVASGLCLRDAMADLVLRPLGLGHTGYGPNPGQGTGLVAGEFGNPIEEAMVAALGLSFDGWRPRGRAILGEADDGNCHYFFKGAAGHAGLFSDARDLASLGRLWLGGGIAPGGPAQGQVFLDPVLAARASQDQGGERGLGFQLGENYPLGGFGHTGFTGTYLQVNKAQGLVIAGLSNRLHVPEPRRINDYWQELSRAVFNAHNTLTP